MEVERTMPEGISAPESAATTTGSSVAVMDHSRDVPSPEARMNNWLNGQLGKPEQSQQQPLTKRYGFTEEEVRANAELSEEKRLQRAEELLKEKSLLETPLTEEQGKALQRMHEVGKDRPGAEVYKYERPEIKEKVKIGREVFSKEQRSLLLESGLAGIAEVTALKEITEKVESDPHYWIDILQELQDLPATEREVRKAEYDTACKQLAVFAHDGKLFGNSAAITILEKVLVDFEKGEIESGTRSKEAQDELRDSLNYLTSQEEDLKRVKASLGLKEQDESSKLFTERGWKDLRDRKDQIEKDILRLKTDIAGKTSPDFLKTRDEKIVDTQVAKTQIIAKNDADQLAELQKGSPDVWEKEQKDRLFDDIEPSPSCPREDTLAKQLVLFNEQQRLKDSKDPSFSPDQYDQARVGLEWYFHDATERGVLEDPEQDLDKKYQEWANALVPHQEVDPYGRSIRSAPKSFYDLHTEIIEYFDLQLDASKPHNVEHASRWRLLQNKGLDPIARQALQGIRAEYLRRAQVQIENSLSNLEQQLKGRPGNISIERISGEWNVRKVEKIIEASKETQEAQELSRPLFVQESYYRIVLLGQNRAEIERGADQAADSIIQSATTFSLEVVRQRMEQLMTAIKEQQSTLQASEKISGQEAQAIVREIQHTYTNKLDFFILDWTSANLLMDQFAGYYSDRMRMAGDEKLKLIPAGHDGLDGLAIHWLTSSEFSLYHRPQGFKGQLADDDQTHKVMRELMKEKIITRLMGYEFKKGNNRIEEVRNRKALTNSPSINEYLQLFDHRGIIPTGIIPEDLIVPDVTGEKHPTKFLSNLTSKERLELFGKLDGVQREALYSLFEQLTPQEQVDIREFQYNEILREMKSKPEETISFNDLVKVRDARQRWSHTRNSFNEARAKAESAFDAADKILNIFGEASVLSAPSIVMRNGPEVVGPEDQKIRRGDFISINDYVLVQKYAILEAGKELATYTDVKGQRIRVDDNAALIRARSKEWIARWKRSGLDRSKTNREFSIALPDGSNVTVKLAAGFEETGLTENEWEAFKDAAASLRENGFLARIKGKTLEEIIKMDHLQPVLNNFLVDYKSSMSEINDPNVIERAARGRFVSIAKIRQRLGFSGIQRLEGTTQQEVDEYTQRIEDSRSLHHELERLAYFEATHDLTKPPITWERGKPVYAFSADRIDYGYQRPWGVKRLHHLKAFWYSNLRRTIPRAADLIHAVPISLTSLAREHSFDSFLQMCWDIKKMESIDNPSLVMTGERHDDLVSIRGSGEGTVAKGQGGLKKVWGFWEKPFVDATALWKGFEGKLQGVGTREAIRKFLADPDSLSDGQAESLVDAVYETLGRLEPLLNASEKSLGEDRQALSAGTGYDENDKFLLRFIEWCMSEKSGGGREDGGMIAQKEIADIIKLITTPGTFKPGVVYIMDPKKVNEPLIKNGKQIINSEQSPSIWEEVARKITPSHNPRIVRKPHPTYQLTA